MGMIKLLTAPIRSIVRFPLFQLAFVVALILFCNYYEWLKTHLYACIRHIEQGFKLGMWVKSFKMRSSLGERRR
jgi:hypothetical protein